MPSLVESLRAIAGEHHVRTDDETRHVYGMDALKRGVTPDVVVLPGSTAEIVAVVRLCARTRTPLVPRGAGTGYTGGAVPVRGGVVLSLERLNRILEIDQTNLIAIVEPNVINGDLQDAVEAVGLFYPPDPASLRISSIGGNVAECAGGPRAFKYGVTRQYVLGLEAVLPTGEIIHTGGKVVKNVVGYDLTQLLVGSEGTLAILTKIILRLIPKPPAVSTLRATFTSIQTAVETVGRIIRSRVVPAALELLDADALEAISEAQGVQLAPPGTEAVLLIEVDGLAEQVKAEADRVEHACVSGGATEVLRARSEAEREELWRVRREISPSLKAIAPIKINHDIVVPKARIPDLFAFVATLRDRFDVRMPCFGHVGDGNLHVNMMIPAGDPAAMTRAKAAEAELFKGVVAMEGAITGEHGIGFSKAAYLPLALGETEIALMKRLKQAFDPAAIPIPGNIFPDEVAASTIPDG
jgi:glycolate oxidase